MAFVYFALAKLGLSISVLQVTPVWPSSGVALAGILLRGYRIWPGILIGACAVNLSNAFDPERVATSLIVNFGVSLGSTIAALIGGALIFRFALGASCFERARHVFRFALFGAIFSTAIAASIGSLSLKLGRFIDPQSTPLIWLTFWTGDMAGVFIFTPLLLAWFDIVRPVRHPWHILEAVFLFGLIIGIGVVTFGPRNIVEGHHFEYMLIPCLLWASFRFDRRGATLAATVASTIAIYGTVMGHGPFAGASYNESLLVLQAFLIVITMTTLVLSAVLNEREERAIALELAIEEARKAHAEAEAANQARNIFLSNMNHELRTPLNHIIGYSDLLKEDAEDAGLQNSIADIEKIKSAGQQLLSIISQILDLSILEAEMMELSVTKFSVSELQVECAAETQTKAEKNANTLSVHVSGDAEVMHSDRSRVKQVLMSVLDNACKFTREGTITMNATRSDGSVVFVIVDTGIGMPPDQVRTLFLPFKQASTGTTREYGGTGLGLAISKMICERIGGDISFVTEPGKGSTFSIRLPESS